MSVKLIWAQDVQGGIGVKNTLPWHLKEDLAYFKTLTKGSAVLMGRNTWESLPVKPLPDRVNIVLSSNMVDGSPETFTSLETALQFYPDVWVIGGGKVYEAALPYADELYITMVNTVVCGADVFAPLVDEEQFVLTSRSEKKFDPDSGLYFTFNRYLRK